MHEPYRRRFWLSRQLDSIEDKLAHLQGTLDHLSATIIKGERTMAADLSALTDAVTNDTTVEQSAITLLEELAAEISAAANDPAAIQALADEVNANAAALAAAVTANTPAAPAA